MPQPPQLSGSLVRSTHTPEQSVSPAGHATVDVVVGSSAQSHVSVQNVGMGTVGQPVGVASGSQISFDSTMPSGLQPGVVRRRARSFAVSPTSS